MIESLARSVRVAVRTLVRDSGFTATAVVVLALGIGTSTAILSIAQALLVEALPYPDGDRLVSVFEDNPAQGMSGVVTSYQTYLDWREADSFEALAVAYNPLNAVIGVDEESTTVVATLVTPDYFDLLGASPVVGRVFDSSDHERPGGHPIAMISAELWARRFESDADVIGRVLVVNGSPYDIVGVMPAGFSDFPNVLQRTDVWLPLMMGPVLVQASMLEDRINRTLPVIARLREGVTLDAARAEMVVLSDRLSTAYPSTHADWVTSMQPVRDLYMGGYRAPVLALLAGSVFLLFIGCANIANLQLARSRAKSSELALRVALGATRVHLWRETLTESAVLTLVGGGAGALAAVLLMPALVSALPLQFPGFVEIAVDASSLLIAAAVTGAAGVGFGLVPLLGLDRGDLKKKLVATGRGSSESVAGVRLRRSLVVAEVAAAVLLLTGAGLFTRSAVELVRTDVGFDHQDLLTLRARIPLESRGPEQMRVLSDELVEAAGALPGVLDAFAWAPHVPGAAFWYTAVRPQDRPELRDDELAVVRFHYVGPGAISALGLRFESGRDFDNSDGLARQVVIVSASLADALWPGEDAVGKILRRWNRETWTEVVGVVEDAFLQGRQGPGGEIHRDVYFPLAMEPQADIALLVRGGGDTVATGVRDVFARLAPDVPVHDVQTMRERVGAEEATPKVTAALAASTAVLALALAAVGLYSVVAYGVAGQRREIGLRMALGAWPTAVLRRVLAQGLVLAVLGIGLGMGAAELLRACSPRLSIR